MAHAQSDLFAVGPVLPEGLRYRAELIDPQAEAALLHEIAALPFQPFQFHGHEGLRRVVWFGWRYDYGRRTLDAAPEIPDFLLGLRRAAAGFAGFSPGDLQQVLVTEYRPGAPIGWHRDRPDFAEVIGVSLLSETNLRFRRKSGPGWARASLTVAPRSAYLLSGPARSQWEHSIVPVQALRYSVTFRRLRAR
jgi:alkylated DNA repair dioxygenase AlkB